MSCLKKTFAQKSFLWKIGISKKIYNSRKESRTVLKHNFSQMLKSNVKMNETVFGSKLRIVAGFVRILQISTIIINY